MPILFWTVIGSVVLYYAVKAIIVGVKEYRKDA